MKKSTSSRAALYVKERIEGDGFWRRDTAARIGAVLDKMDVKDWALVDALVTAMREEYGE